MLLQSFGMPICNLLLSLVLQHGRVEDATVYHLVKQYNQPLIPGQIGIDQGAFTLIHQIRDIDLPSPQALDPLLFLHDFTILQNLPGIIC